jgi:hypothetical protein
LACCAGLLLLAQTAAVSAAAGGGYGGRGMHDGFARGDAGEKPKHFVVALIDDLGGFNVPWRNPGGQTMSEDLLRLSTEVADRLTGRGFTQTHWLSILKQNVWIITDDGIY